MKLTTSAGIGMAMLLSIACTKMFAQRPAQFMKTGNAAEERNAWDEAFSYYEQGYLLDTSSFDFALKYAEAARHIRNYALAEKLYQRNYDKDNGKLFPDGLYWLAAMQKYNGKYEDAQRNFRKYQKKFKGKGDAQLIKRSDHDAKSALWALEYKQKDEATEIIHLDKKINTTASEISPFQQNQQMFYASGTVSGEGEMWKIYSTTLDQENAPELFPVGGMSSDISKANYTVSSTGSIFFSAVVDGVSRIYQLGNNTATALSDEVNMPGVVNTMPAYAVIGEKHYLFFVANRDGGEGGMDIWYSHIRQDKNDSGKQIFDEPKNAGKVINTQGDELTPFYFEDKFYFSSDWHDGFGGQDIFSCAWNGTSFSGRENLGKPVNSSVNDFYYSRNEENAFFSSNRDGSVVADSNATCCNDLYRVKLSGTKDDVADSLNNNPEFSTLAEMNEQLPVTLYFHNDEPNPRTMDTTTALSYAASYISYLNLVPVYLKENSKGLAGEKREDSESITNDFFDLKVKKGMTDLKLFSNLLLKELEKGQSLQIAVRGFASPRAKTDYNLNLTKRRTASLVNYLEQDSSDAFLPYIKDESANGAHLEFELLPFGEYQADKSVSDDLVDEKNSIYNRAACLERKIEIEKVIVIPSTKKTPVLTMDSERHDFGKIPKQGAVHHSFLLKNTGNAPMKIDSVVAECGCTDPRLDKYLLLPGETGALDIGFDPFGKKGPDEKRVMIYIAGHEPRVITIIAEREK